MSENIDYRRASPNERVHGWMVGDPVGDYIGCPAIQFAMIADEQLAEAAKKSSPADESIAELGSISLRQVMATESEAA